MTGQELNTWKIKTQKECDVYNARLKKIKIWKNNGSLLLFQPIKFNKVYKFEFLISCMYSGHEIYIDLNPIHWLTLKVNCYPTHSDHVVYPQILIFKLLNKKWFGMPIYEKM